MDRAVQKAWTEALRSGDYPQGRGHLRGPDGYCCLGVLCDISGIGTWIDDETTLAMRYQVGYDILTAGVGIPPTKVVRWAGILSGVQTLAELNDSGMSFALIADWIDANLASNAGQEK